MSLPINYNSYFEKYTLLVKEENIITAFKNQDQTLQDFYEKITEEKSLYAYAEGKWTLKEMLQHMIDTERILSYRALAIARKETAVLPSFDEDAYANNSDANRRTWASLVEEMKQLRKSTQLMVESFTENMLQNLGKFGNATNTSQTLVFIMVGHVYHHINVANELYAI